MLSCIRFFTGMRKKETAFERGNFDKTGRHVVTARLPIFENYCGDKALCIDQMPQIKPYRL